MSIFRPKEGLRIGKIIKGLGYIILDMFVSDKVAKKCIEQGLGHLFDEIEENGEDPKPTGTSTGRRNRNNSGATNGGTANGTTEGTANGTTEGTANGGTANGTTEGTANGGTANGTTEGTANGGEETGSQSGAA